MKLCCPARVYRPRMDYRNSSSWRASCDASGLTGEIFRLSEAHPPSRDAAIRDMSNRSMGRYFTVTPLGMRYMSGRSFSKIVCASSKNSLKSAAVESEG